MGPGTETGSGEHATGVGLKLPRHPCSSRVRDDRAGPDPRQLPPPNTVRLTFPMSGRPSSWPVTLSSLVAIPWRLPGAPPVDPGRPATPAAGPPPGRSSPWLGRSIRSPAASTARPVVINGQQSSRRPALGARQSPAGRRSCGCRWRFSRGNWGEQPRPVDGSTLDLEWYGRESGGAGGGPAQPGRRGGRERGGTLLNVGGGLGAPWRRRSGTAICRRRGCSGSAQLGPTGPPAGWFSTSTRPPCCAAARGPAHVALRRPDQLRQLAALGLRSRQTARV